MPGIAVTLTVALLAVLGGIYQLQLKPVLTALGVGRVLQPTGTDNCYTVPELQACEKLVLHQPSGHLYLACSTPASRTHWTPAVDRLNATGMSREDFVAVFDPASRAVTKLALSGFASPRGINVHGMDVVPSSAEPGQLFVYLINHRAPEDADARNVGADSCVEVFRTSVGARTLTHVRTVEDAVIATPNDLVGAPDGAAFWFTNDHGSKTGLGRHLEPWLRRAVTSVGYCHADAGCKTAVTHIVGANGIARDAHGVFYVANSAYPELRVLERQADDSLVVTDLVSTTYPLDNLAVDAHGYVWGAGLPKAMELVTKHFDHPDTFKTASSALRISLNTGREAYFGEKYKIEKLFEDDGTLASGSTSAVFDSERQLLFMHGLASPHLTVCKIAPATTKQT